MKRNKWLLFLFLIAGAVVGLLIGELTQNIPFLSWLGFAGEFGVGAEHPVALDLIILKLQFGLTFRPSVAVILCMIFAGLLFRRFAR
jgi:hypothetical protein